ncbi:lysophospholipid acyltransferase family protein [Cellulomonas marina]|uniref:1-acyl-sn-glycerol-3-phosphate acyltransferase n=1 Tax=Cellulomonas marina TaxID=988821 RepID=A0A1I0ZWS8_9CELL|nr:lysophospholipid acyltransferase family protein [Cellulomonas marina]GIG29415.1 1-acyl-sn-glycerol-3-phosphate acyltransferase [Cellulomonas marina]SFB30041.1 1-acyl-sn-glycerol-3-phosphate acyltransferase [Cellulomonas marina]
MSGGPPAAVSGAPDAPGASGAPAAPAAWGPVWARQVGRALSRGWWATEVVGAGRVPRTGPVILAANHTGVADGPLLVGLSPRPLHILVKQEMFRGPVGTVLRLAGQISVDRTNGRPALATGLAVLRRGGAVGVFPEGTRGSGAVASARAGVAWLAVNAGAPVVPVAILGTRRTGESSGHVPPPRRRLLLELGEPLDVGRRPGETSRDAVGRAAEEVRTALAALVVAASERSGLPLPLDDPGARRAP